MMFHKDHKFNPLIVVWCGRSTTFNSSRTTGYLKSYRLYGLKNHQLWHLNIEFYGEWQKVAIQRRIPFSKVKV